MTEHAQTINEAARCAIYLLVLYLAVRRYLTIPEAMAPDVARLLRGRCLLVAVVGVFGAASFVVRILDADALAISLIGTATSVPVAFLAMRHLGYQSRGR